MYRTTPRLTRTFLASLAVTALALAGCGDDGDSADDTPDVQDTTLTDPTDGTGSGDGGSSTPDTTEPESDAGSGSDDEGGSSDRFFTVTVGGETYEFSSVTWCDEDDGAWEVTATGDGRTMDASIEFNPDSPATSNALVVNLDNQDTTMASDPTTRWRATEVEGTFDGTSASGTATLEAEMGDAPPAAEAEWSFACESF